MTEVIQVSEWGRVELPPHLDSPNTRLRLYRCAITQFGEALVLRGRSIYAQGIVGIIDAGNVQVQIVPKVYDVSTEKQDTDLLLRLFLLNAPKNAFTVVQAATATHRASVLEPLIRYFAKMLQRQIRTDGIPRRYEERSEESSTLRGRVDLPKLVRKSPVYSNRLPIIYHPLQSDNALSRVLRSLALELASRSAVAQTKAALYRCSDLLAQARIEPLRPALIEAIYLTRYEERWRPFLDLAGILAANTSPDPVRPGNRSKTAILMPLERLFENALREALRRAAQKTSLRISGDTGNIRLLKSLKDSREIFTLRPDLIFRDSSGEARVIGDAKWKRLKADRPGRGVTPEDIYQIFVYTQRYSVSTGVLFYPASEPIIDTWRCSTWTLMGEAGRTIDIVEIDTARMLAAAKSPADQDVVSDLTKLVEYLAATAEQKFQGNLKSLIRSPEGEPPVSASDLKGKPGMPGERP